MKKIFLLLSLATLPVFFSGCGKKQENTGFDKSYLNNRERMESYVLGRDVAFMVKNAGDYRNEFIEPVFWQGFEDVVNYRDTKAPVEEMKYVFSDPDSVDIRINNIELEGLNDRKSKQSYLIAFYHSFRLSENPETFEMKSFREGFNNEFTEKPHILSNEEMAEVREKSIEMLERLDKNADPETDIQKKAEINREFLTENAKREKVKTLPSGLQYVVMKEGGGQKITGTEKIKVEYRAYFVDGREFDSSYQKGEPAEFDFSEDIIPGWREGLKLMRKGGRYKLFVPSELAYGNKGYNEIPPYSTLIFDIQIIDVYE